MKKYQMPHAKAMANIRTGISFSLVLAATRSIRAMTTIRKTYSMVQALLSTGDGKRSFVSPEIYSGSSCHVTLADEFTFEGATLG